MSKFAIGEKVLYKEEDYVITSLVSDNEYCITGRGHLCAINESELTAIDSHPKLEFAVGDKVTYLSEFQDEGQVIVADPKQGSEEMPYKVKFDKRGVTWWCREDQLERREEAVLLKYGVGNGVTYIGPEPEYKGQYASIEKIDGTTNPFTYRLRFSNGDLIWVLDRDIEESPSVELIKEGEKTIEKEPEIPAISPITIDPSNTFQVNDIVTLKNARVIAVYDKRITVSIDDDEEPIDISMMSAKLFERPLKPIPPKTIAVWNGIEWILATRRTPSSEKINLFWISLDGEASSNIGLSNGYWFDDREGKKISEEARKAL